MKFGDIKQFPHSAYRVNVSLDYLEKHLEGWDERILGKEIKKGGLLLQPSYQRGYVWTREQQISYMEYILKGGQSGRDVYFNNPTWNDSYTAHTECVDGQQRIGAALAFVRDEIKCFGYYYSEYEDKLCANGDLIFHIMKIKSRKELLETYIAMNRGGSYHTEKDLAPAYEELNKL